MKYLSLVMVGLRRRLLRTLLTGVSIFVAFVLLGITSGVTAGFDEALELMSDARLRVVSRANIIEPIPIAHLQRIEQIDGVASVSPLAIFPAYYQQQLNNVSSAAMDIDSMLEVFPEIVLSAEEVNRLKSSRTGATVGKTLADRFGWQVGDQIPLTSYFLAQRDGSTTWTFEIMSIHNDGPKDEELLAGEIYFHYDYLNESRAQNKDTVNMFLVVVDNPDQAGEIAGQIDALFRNSSDETQTMNEKQFLTNQLRSVGDIGSVIASVQFAVLFTLLFIAGSTMTQSVRERISEFGVLKSLGFTDAAVAGFVIGEALILCLLAALLGLSLAAAVFPSIFGTMGLGGAAMDNSVWVNGLLVALLLALLVSTLPVWQLYRLNPVDALRRT